MEKEPRPTRHRVVLTLKKPVDVFDMQNTSSSNVREIIDESIGAQPMFQTNKIATRRYVKRYDLPGFADLSIYIYSTMNQSKTKNDRVGEGLKEQAIQQTCKATRLVVTIPHEWTPALFLVLLNKSINNHHVISLKKINMHGITSLSSLNTVHWYFRCEIDNLKVSLQQDDAYSGGFGGVI